VVVVIGESRAGRAEPPGATGARIVGPAGAGPAVESPIPRPAAGYTFVTI